MTNLMGMSRDVRSLAFNSIHEAGHAVVGQHLGMNLRGISVSEDTGNTRWTFNVVPPDRENALMTVSGVVATILYGFDLGKCVIGGATDYKIVESLGYQPHVLFEEAAEILRLNFDKVSDLAMTLMDARHVDRSEFAAAALEEK